MQSGALGWTANNRLGVKLGLGTTSAQCPDYPVKAAVKLTPVDVSKVPTTDIREFRALVAF